MIFNWPDFRIYLPDLDAYLRSNLDGFDGLLAGEDLRVILLREETVADREMVTSYLGSLSEQAEAQKFLQEQTVPNVAEILLSAINRIEDHLGFPRTRLD